MGVTWSRHLVCKSSALVYCSESRICPPLPDSAKITEVFLTDRLEFLISLDVGKSYFIKFSEEPYYLQTRKTEGDEESQIYQVNECLNLFLNEII